MELTDLKGKKLGLLLSTPETDSSVGIVARLAETALAHGVDVYLYLIDEGVKNLRDPRLTSLSARGMKLFVCAYGCQRHKVSTEGLDPSISLCGLVVLSNIMNGCDRFLAFN